MSACAGATTPPSLPPALRRGPAAAAPLSYRHRHSGGGGGGAITVTAVGTVVPAAAAAVAAAAGTGGVALARPTASNARSAVIPETLNSLHFV
jgi:hypothetical protein